MTPRAPVPVRLFYVDDSGSPDSGWIVYSWIECAIGDWRSGLRIWLDLRRQMFVEHRIPPAYGLHAAHFIGGRGARRLKLADRHIIEDPLFRSSHRTL